MNLLTDSMDSFRINCLKDIKPNLQRIKELMDNSLMLVTALNPKIGYDKSAQIAKNAHKKNLSLK
jgi:fumarate hydratase class II